MPATAPFVGPKKRNDASPRPKEDGTSLSGGAGWSVTGRSQWLERPKTGAQDVVMTHEDQQTARSPTPSPPSGGASEFGSGQKPRTPHTHPCGRSHPSNPGRGAGELRGSLPIYNKLSPVKVVNYGLSRRRLRGRWRATVPASAPSHERGGLGHKAALNQLLGWALKKVPGGT